MKHYKICLTGFVLLLSFSFILEPSKIVNYEQDDKKYRDAVIPLTASKSVAYEWDRTWGGSNDEHVRGMGVDSSGNIYIAGSTDSFGAGAVDMVLVKYDGNGVQQWNRTWGGSDFDVGFGAAVDSSSNIYLAGDTRSFRAGAFDMVLVKYDGNGVQQWNRTWGGSDSDVGYGVAVDSSSNIYLAGDTRSFGAGFNDMVLVKYDGNGVQQWNRTWGGEDWDECHEVAVDSSGNIYLAGSTESFGANMNDMVLVKYDRNGVQHWNRTWGGIIHDEGYGMAVDSSGNIYLVGYTSSFGAGYDDMVLVKYDENGVQQWNRTWGGSDSDVGYGAAVDSSSNIYLAGYTSSFGVGVIDMVLVKYDGSGVQQWYRTWGGENWDEGHEVAVDSSSNIYLAGFTKSFGAGSFDMVLVKWVISERLDGVKIVIIIVSIASVVGVGIALTYFIRKRRKILS